MSAIAWFQQLTSGLPVIRPQQGKYVGVTRLIHEWRLSRLVKPDAAEQVRKTGVLAHRIKEGVYFKVLQNV
jgi:hypothetical protein